MTNEEIIQEEFDTMRGMLDNIQEKTKKVDSLKLMQFYAPIKNMIFEAWQDACNPEDKFLYPFPNKLKAV